MPSFRYYHPIEVRYGDLDPQGHVNNARYLTYMEQARISYIQQLGLWQGDSFLDVGVILADAQVIFKESIQYGQPLRVGVRVSRLGVKSLTMEYQIEDAGDGRALATGATVLVAYDYRRGRSLPLPDDWRRILTEYEMLS
ncbi:MAG TPA: thioesterase family protein [Anaerolineales bacterium]|nr:thioesterase family protein [Anaerolineales bacterium]